MKILITSLIFVVLLGYCSAQTMPPGSAVISDLKGEVFLTFSSQTSASPAQKGQAIGPNTLIDCKKGSALLLLSDGSQVLVKPNTRVILRDPNAATGSYLEQLIGKVVATVKKRMSGEPSFKMGTPTAVITVRGTKFLVDVNKNQQTFVQVFEGLVEVQGLNTGHSVFLQPGFVTQVKQNQDPERPRKLMDEAEAGSGGGSSFSKHSDDSRDLRNRGNGQSGQGSGTNGEIDD